MDIRSPIVVDFVRSLYLTHLAAIGNALGHSRTFRSSRRRWVIRTLRWRFFRRRFAFLRLRWGRLLALCTCRRKWTRWRFLRKNFASRSLCRFGPSGSFRCLRLHPFWDRSCGRCLGGRRWSLSCWRGWGRWSFPCRERWGFASRRRDRCWRLCRSFAWRRRLSKRSCRGLPFIREPSACLVSFRVECLRREVTRTERFNLGAFGSFVSNLQRTVCISEHFAFAIDSVRSSRLAFALHLDEGASNCRARLWTASERRLRGWCRRLWSGWRWRWGAFPCRRSRSSRRWTEQSFRVSRATELCLQQLGIDGACGFMDSAIRVDDHIDRFTVNVYSEEFALEFIVGFF